jgi:hypothetical protein
VNIKAPSGQSLVSITDHPFVILTDTNGS